MHWKKQSRFKIASWNRLYQKSVSLNFLKEPNSNMKVQARQPVNAKIPEKKSQTKVIEQRATEEYEPTVSEEPWMIRKT